MAGINIPREMHEKVVSDFKCEYEQTLGTLTEDVRDYSREELVAKYAAAMAFWKKRIPAIDPEKRPTIETICRHLVTTNAVSNLKKYLEQHGIYDDVVALLDRDPLCSS